MALYPTDRVEGIIQHTAQRIVALASNCNFMLMHLPLSLHQIALYCFGLVTYAASPLEEVKCVTGGLELHWIIWSPLAAVCQCARKSQQEAECLELFRLTDIQNANVLFFYFFLQSLSEHWAEQKLYFRGQ